MPLETGAQVLEQAPGLLTLAHHNVFVAVWTATPDALKAAQVNAAYHRFLATRTGDVAAIIWVRGSSSPPDAATRNSLIRTMQAGVGRCRAVAFVIELDGLTGAAARAVATGMTLVARPPFPVRVHARVPDAVLWLHDQLAQGSAERLDSAALIAALQGVTLRASHLPAAPH